MPGRLVTVSVRDRAPRLARVCGTCVGTVVRHENSPAAMSGFGRPCATSWATGSQVRVSAARPAIRGGVTVMDSIVEAEDAAGSGSEHGGNAEIA
jgi:hypothetical protein